MNHKLHVELFFFDATTDYLPHYKHFTCILDEKQTLKDLLKNIQERHPSFEYPKQKTLLQVNAKLVDARLKIKELVRVFGTRLTLEPASIFRAYKDLRFDDHDFMEKYALLAPYCDHDDLKYYRTLYHTYYASETLRYNPDYYGDALFLLALRLLRREEHEDAILDIVSHKQNGLDLYEYENNSYPAHDISPEIEIIKTMLENRCFIHSDQMQPLKALIDNIKERFCREQEDETFSAATRVLIEHYNIMSETIEEDNELDIIEKHIGFERVLENLKHPFTQFNIAFYTGPLHEDLPSQKSASFVASIGGIFVPFDAATKACGATIVRTAPDIAYQKAGNILLAAMDNNIDLLIVNTPDALNMLNNNIKRCEKAVGRDIDLQIVTPSQLVAIATGCTHDKEALGFNKKGSTITFI